MLRRASQYKNATSGVLITPASVRVREAPRRVPCWRASKQGDRRSGRAHHSAAMNSQTEGSTHICRGKGPGGIEGIILDIV
jgi:hypothetical protein